MRLSVRTRPVWRRQPLFRAPDQNSKCQRQRRHGDAPRGVIFRGVGTPSNRTQGFGPGARFHMTRAIELSPEPAIDMPGVSFAPRPPCRIAAQTAETAFERRHVGAGAAARGHCLRPPLRVPSLGEGRRAAARLLARVSRRTRHEAFRGTSWMPRLARCRSATRSLPVPAKPPAQPAPPIGPSARWRSAPALPSQSAMTCDCGPRSQAHLSIRRKFTARAVSGAEKIVQSG